jgi:hypothetical protein
MGSKEYIHIIAEKLGTAILKFDGPIYDDYCRLVHEGHTYRITSSMSVEKACNGLLYSDEDSMKLEMRLKSKEWNGEGLPPVGCRVEAYYGGEWVEATVAYTGRPEGHSDAVAWKEALVFDCKTTRPFWADGLRPIRSEADKKRAECVIALSRIDPQAMPFEYGDKHSDGSLIGPFWYELYDAIAAGKIPHIRID